MLQQSAHIEGLSSIEDHEIYDDTNPGQIITKFYVVAEEMPYESNLAAQIVRKNFVWVSRIWDLGRSSYARRVHDEVFFDEKTQKWTVKRLAPNMLSDIKKNPIEWNAFYNNSKAEAIGVPIAQLFKNDPSRAEFYKDRHIDVIEQLASLNEKNIDDLGMGVRADFARAKAYLAKIKEQAPALQMNAKIEEKEQQIQFLQKQLTELSSKLNEVLESQTKEKTKGK